jgi:hypothetical protein
MFENLTLSINDVSHFSFMTILKVEDMPNYYLQGLSWAWPGLAAKFHAFSDLGTDGHNSHLNLTLPDCRMGPEIF